MGGDGSVLQNGPHPEVGEPASLPQKPVHGPPSGPVQGSDPLKQLRSTQTSRLVQDPEVLWDQQVLTDADLLR